MFKLYSSVAELHALDSYKWVIERNSNVARRTLERTNDAKFLGLDSAQDCLNALTAGYPAGVEKIDETMEKLANLPRAIGIGRVLVRGMFGDELDVHAINRGDVGNMFTSRKRLLKKGVSNIRIVIDICGNAGVSANQLLWRGVAGLALSNIFTKAKYKTEIVGAIAVRGHCDTSDTDVMAITVKPFGVIADNNMLASTVCLSGFFRTLGFLAIIKQADERNMPVDSGLGISVNIEHHYPTDNKCTQIIVPCEINNQAECLKWLDDTVKFIQGVTK